MSTFKLLDGTVMTVQDNPLAGFLTMKYLMWTDIADAHARLADVARGAGITEAAFGEPKPTDEGLLVEVTLKDEAAFYAFNAEIRRRNDDGDFPDIGERGFL